MAVAANSFFSHVKDFMDYRRSVYELSPETIRSNTLDLLLFEQFIHKGKHARIDGQATMDFQKYLKVERLNAGSSINRKIFTLRAYAHYLKLKELADAHSLPFEDVLKIRNGYRQRPGQLEKDQLAELFGTLDLSTYLGLRDYTVYALMYLLGLRVGEVRGIDLSQLDLQKKKLTVTGKGKRKRTLQLTDNVMAVLGQWLTVRPFFRNKDNSDALFLSKKGNRLAIRTMEDNFKKLRGKTNLKTTFSVTCHTLRHTFASHLHEQNVDMLVIQDLLGHSSPRSTEIYIHTSLDRIRQALEKVPAAVHMKQLLDSGRLKITFQKPTQHQRK